VETRREALSPLVVAVGTGDDSSGAHLLRGLVANPRQALITGDSPEG